MARKVILAALASCAGCFHAAPYSASATQAEWRSMRARQGAGVAGVGRFGAGTALTADETYAAALANSPDVVALDAEADALEAEVAAERQIDNPQLRFTGFNVDDVITNDTQVNVGLRVPIPRPGTVKARAAGAQQLADGQRSWSDDAKRLLRQRIDTLYATLAVLNEDLEQTAHATAIQARNRDQIAERAALSAATKLDVAIAETLHAEAKQDEAQVRGQIESVERELSRIIGADVPVRFVVDPKQLELVDARPDRDALTERAMKLRPELKAAHHNLQAARAEVHIARSEAWPWFDWAQIQYRIEENPQPAAWGFAVAFTLPIFSWNRGEIRASRAVVRQRELERRAQIALVAAEVDEAATRVEITARRVQEIDRELLPRLAETVSEAEAAVASRTLDPGELAKLEERAVKARRLRLEALLEHRVAVIDLETAVGEALAAKTDRKDR
jgi:multidrug efflux system outer membrane protein